MAQNSRPEAEAADTYTFMCEDGRWYIYLAGSLAHGWQKQDLELTEGTHKVLNMLANGAKKVRLRLSQQPFEGANVLELVELCDAPRGGGIYVLNPHKNCNSDLFWICDLALFVFGDMPGRMYVKRLPQKEKAALLLQPVPNSTIRWLQSGS